MYEYMSGMIVKVNPKYVVLDNHNIGYKIYVPNPYNYKENEYYTIYTYFHVREDINDLYGFLDSEERDLFLKLISVTGIGPKTALPILAASKVDEIKEAILSGNVKYMQKFPGIGPKAAQQIILDLKGKVDFSEPMLVLNDNLSDSEEALIALGYNKKDVKKALEKVNASLDTALIIKDALKILSKL